MIINTEVAAMVAKNCSVIPLMAYGMVAILALIPVAVITAGSDVIRFMFNSAFTRDAVQRHNNQELLASFILSTQKGFWDSVHSGVNWTVNTGKAAWNWLKKAGSALVGGITMLYMVVALAIIGSLIFSVAVIPVAIFALCQAIGKGVKYAKNAVVEAWASIKEKVEARQRRLAQEAEWNKLVEEALAEEVEVVESFNWIQRLLGIDKICGRMDALEKRVAAIEEKLSEVAPQPVPVEEVVVEEVVEAYDYAPTAYDTWRAEEEKVAQTRAAIVFFAQLLRQQGQEVIIDADSTDMSVVKQITNNNAVNVLTIEMIENMKWNEMQKLAKAANVSYVKKEGKQGLKLRLIKSVDSVEVQEAYARMVA